MMNKNYFFYYFRGAFRSKSIQSRTCYDHQKLQTRSLRTYLQDIREEDESTTPCTGEWIVLKSQEDLINFCISTNIVGL